MSRILLPKITLNIIKNSFFLLHFIFIFKCPSFGLKLYVIQWVIDLFDPVLSNKIPLVRMDGWLSHVYLLEILVRLHLWNIKILISPFWDEHSISSISWVLLFHVLVSLLAEKRKQQVLLRKPLRVEGLDKDYHSTYVQQIHLVTLIKLGDSPFGSNFRLLLLDWHQSRIIYHSDILYDSR